ncbi:glycosyltransferase sdnJ [Hirsutella rhossiliensis]|uniref:Glycosyltransferase sdnJ n=1 Tax=Hirsutella rhossiliensis TaxID=111463 RepID=A0A9P8SMF8_9HYPO|nr:glycosyltransferase sdnJ [Hirsutella rhossiliensis]KAH0967966.1 glycosyltransferase sdnJ [Hirsutella rhossiliensis]
MAAQRLPQRLPLGHRANNKILMLTNAERGEANVFLATCHALLEADPGLELHFATFDGLQQTVAQVSDNVRRAVPHAKPIVFHQIKGPTMTESIMQHLARNCIPRKADGSPESWMTPLRFFSSLRAIRDTIPIIVPYRGSQLVDIISYIAAIIEEVAADLVVVDSLMTPGLTACYHLGIKFTCLSPNNIKMFAGPAQPWLASLWKWPALFSGYPYPVPLHLIPFNLCLIIYMVIIWRRDAHRRQATDYLLAQIGAHLFTPIDLARRRLPDLKILVSTHSELDFPLVHPPHVYPCGPIVRAAPAIADADPELLTWLARGPTVYINLGSFFSVDQDQALELAQALKIALDTLDKKPGADHVQVLWKLKLCKDPCVGNGVFPILDTLSRQFEDGRIRIVEWVQAEPISILQSGHIACSVHHGGANSYNEAVIAGVPQVVLPQWSDCYDYAELVQVLGIGRLGSKTTKPRWTAPELSHELLAVLDGEPARAMTHKAQQLASLCEKRGSGAAKAARILLEELSNEPEVLMEKTSVNGG